jgi:hypothetical protein
MKTIPLFNLNLVIIFLKINLIYSQCFVIKLENEDKKGNANFAIKYEYDEKDRLKKIIHPDFITKQENPNHYVEYIYDGDKIKIINECSPSEKGDETYKKISHLFLTDEKGRIKQIKTFNALNGKGTLLYENHYGYDEDDNVIYKTTLTKLNSIKDSSVFRNYINGRPQESVYFFYDKKKKKYDNGTVYKYTYDKNNNLIKTEKVEDEKLILVNESTFNTEVLNYNDSKILSFNRLRNNPNFNNKDFDPNMPLTFKSYSDYCVINGTGQKVPLFKSSEATYTILKNNSKGFVTNFKLEYKEFDCQKPKKELIENTLYYEIQYECK